MASDTFLLQLMGGDVNARFDAQGVADEGRLVTWRATLRLQPPHIDRLKEAVEAPAPAVNRLFADRAPLRHRRHVVDSPRG